MPRRVVYTVLIGGYEPLLEQPVAGGFETDLVCLTDDPGLRSDTWERRASAARDPSPPAPRHGLPSSRRREWMRSASETRRSRGYAQRASNATGNGRVTGVPAVAAPPPPPAKPVGGLRLLLDALLARLRRR